MSREPEPASHLPWDYHLYRNFPVKITRFECFECFENTPMFQNHWHEQMQIIYFEKGEATILCNAISYTLKAGDILIINCNEIHYGMTHHGNLIFHIIKPGFNFLASSQEDWCQTKYIAPLMQGHLVFQNQISADTALSAIIQKVIAEFNTQNIGFELIIKSYIYQILVYLLRHYQKGSAPSAQERQQKTLYQLRSALDFIDKHYTENIHLCQLASLANMSSQHFCRLFKGLTGKSPIDYINSLRIDKAVTLLTEDHLNISEIAQAVGFDDSNYFSRIFRKYKKISPTTLKKGVTK
ncbi:MAG: AraC family transcriptional regulator [Pelosinus sp.]|nr:AraC family transcriptional regulator [Pelosinus sp.]